MGIITTTHSFSQTKFVTAKHIFANLTRVINLHHPAIAPHFLLATNASLIAPPLATHQT